MYLNSVERANELLIRATAEGRVRQVRPEQGPNIDPQVEVAEGGTTYTLEKSQADGKWRWAWATTYGDSRAVHGAGCDDWGYVIRDPELTWKLNKLVEPDADLVVK